MIAIKTEQLSKTFGSGKKSVTAVKNLDLRVESEQVYGFLGPNGAGKSTTIRMLMDLIRPTGGHAQLFDQNVRRNPGVLRRVGALVEGACFYDYLSARDNLRVLAKTSNEDNPERIGQLLEQVGIASRADSRVGGYSTGMKQRLGIAAALLSDPDLIILDEPTNGLDPAGIQEMRTFIRGLAHEQGKTVFLSSHLLSEVEQVCDRVAIIHKGELIREGSVRDLLADGHGLLRIEAKPLEKALAILQKHWQVEVENGDWLAIQASNQQSPLIVKQLVAQDVAVHQVVVVQQTLEAYFMSVTQEGVDDD